MSARLPPLIRSYASAPFKKKRKSILSDEDRVARLQASIPRGYQGLRASNEKGSVAIEHIIRISATYKKLRDMTSFLSLEKAFYKQRDMESTAKTSLNPSRRQTFVENQAGSWKDFMGQRGVPIVSPIPLTAEERQAFRDRHPEPHTFNLDFVDERMFRTTRLTNVRPRLKEKPPLSLLRVRFTTIQPTAGPGTNYSSPPLDLSTANQPMVPPSYLPPPETYAQPLFVIRLQPAQPFDPSVDKPPLASHSDGQALRHRRQVETSPAYLREIQRLLANEPGPADPKLAEVIAHEIFKRREKLDGRIGVERKKARNADWPDDVRVISLGLMTYVGIKSVHPMASVRKKVKRKCREALVYALQREWEESSPRVKEALRFNGWSAVIRPTAQVKLAPMEVLIDHMRSALVNAIRKEKYTGVRQGGFKHGPSSNSAYSASSWKRR